MSAYESIEELYAQLKISPLPGKKREWILLDELEYVVTGQGKPFIIKVPKGFKFDGCSVPKIFHTIAAPMSTHSIIAGCVHDWLFVTKKYSLTVSNEIFNEVNLSCKCPERKRIIMYLGLVLGSWYTRYFGKEYGVYRKKSKKK